MTRLLIGTLALVLATATPALAQPQRSHAGGSRPSVVHMSGHAPARAHFAARRPAAHHRSVRTTTHRTVHRTVSRHGTTRHVVRRTTRHTVRRPPHHVSKRVVVNKKTTVRFAKSRRAIFAKHRFHVGVYRRPGGWFAHHWVIGNRLPRAWFVRDYWITDWAIYGLWAPIDGLVWVRVGPDAMLIDPVTGEVVGLEYGIFW